MLYPVSPSVSPQGDFCWKERGTDFPTLHHSNSNVLFDMIKERKITTGAFLGQGWIEQTWHEICEDSKLDCRDKAIPERAMNFSDFEQFLHVVDRSLSSGDPYVGQDEAERRALICAACPRNQPMVGACSGCHGMASWIGRLVSGRRTMMDGVLQNCGVCSCRLSIAVHIALEVQKDDRFKAEEWPQACWKKPQ